MSQTSCIDLFAILLSRMNCPARLVRLMAARQIAKLLKDDASGELRKKYLDWIGTQKYETGVVDCLAVLSLSGYPPPIKFADVLHAINRPSILADLYINSIFLRTPMIKTWFSASSGPVPTEFKAPDYFPEHLGTFTAPIFRTKFEQLERITGLPFMRQWEWEWQCLAERYGYWQSSLSHFINGREEVVSDFEARTSAIYLSSYLRTLHFAIEKWEMPLDRAEDLALRAAPANIAFSKIMPRGRLAGWPNADTDEKADKLASAVGLEEALTDFARTEKDEIVVAASAPIYKSPLRLLEMRIMSGWAPPSYKAQAEVLFDQMYFPMKSVFRLGIPDKLMPESSSNSQYNSESLLPSVVWPPDPWPRWHSDIFFRGFFLPAPFMFDEALSIEILPNEVKFLSAGQTVSRWYYWYEKWSLSHPNAASSAAGTVLWINRDFLKTYMAKSGMQFHRSVCLRKLFRNEYYGSYNHEDLHHSVPSDL